jgi:plastocyanin
MTPKAMLASALLCAVVLAGCTGGSDKGGSSSTSTSGAAGAGGCVTVGGSGGCSNATVSGSASYSTTSSTGSGTNGTTNGTMQQTVRIENGAFQPDEVTVRAGGTVTWEHHDGGTAHTVTADDGSFDSSPSCNTPLPVGDCLMDGDTFSYTFPAAGDFGYHDKLHTSMTGVVHVVQQ